MHNFTWPIHLAPTRAIYNILLWILCSIRETGSPLFHLAWWIKIVDFSRWSRSRAYETIYILRSIAHETINSRSKQRNLYIRTRHRFATGIDRLRDVTWLAGWYLGKANRPMSQPVWKALGIDKAQVVIDLSFSSFPQPISLDHGRQRLRRLCTPTIDCLAIKDRYKYWLSIGNNSLENRQRSVNIDGECTIGWSGSNDPLLLSLFLFRSILLLLLLLRLSWKYDWILGGLSEGRLIWRIISSFRIQNFYERETRKSI